VRAAGFMHEKLDPIMLRLFGRPLQEGGSVQLMDLIAAEKREREEIPKLFRWLQ